MKLCSPLHHSRRFLLLLPILAALTGCGMGNLDTSASSAFSLSGKVRGGQQPVTGSTIQLYIAGTSGNGSTATAMITSKVVQTDPTGSFTITGDYNCVNSTDQVYLTATGGNPGLTDPTTNNNALVLVAAIGNCSNLASIPNLDIDEVTTVAAVYALAPFISLNTTAAPYFNIGATSTNSAGLANAFLDARLLADITSGSAVTYANGSNLSIQAAKLYALADAISYCVNSASSISTACASLVTASTPNGVAPAANTIATTLSIVQHPGSSKIVGPVWNLINSQAPFPTTPLTQAPYDWTMTLTITGGGLNSPTALAIDASSNVWVADYNGGLSAFGPQGAAFNSTGYGTSILAECFGLTIDTSGNIWVTNFEAPSSRGSLSKFLGASSGTPGTAVTNTANSTYFFTDASIDFPTALATDTTSGTGYGDIGIANFASSSASIYNPTSKSFTTTAAGDTSEAAGVAFDSSHGLWIANQGNGTVTHVSSNGTLLAQPSCCDGAEGIALDVNGNAWIANYSGGYVYASTPSGAGQADATGGGLSSGQPVGIAVDAAQNIWVADGDAGIITALGANTGLAVSPSTGYGLDAGLSDPHGIAPDASGNIWISDFGKNTVVMFFGLATPTVTPVRAIPTAP